MDLQSFKVLAYNARRDVLKHMAGIWDEDMAGACGVASLHLMRLAEARGVRSVFVGGYHRVPESLPGRAGHCWLEYQGHVVDITATQFNHNAKLVHIEPINHTGNYIKDLVWENFVDAMDGNSSWMVYPSVLLNII